MKFYRSLLTNHPLVNILFAVVVIMGMLSYASMPRQQDPEINFNWLQVNTALPGAAASDVEQLITGPLEDAIRGVRDIDFVSSQSSEGLSSMLIRLEDVGERTADKRISELRREIQNKFNDELPPEALDPYIMELNSSSQMPTALVLVVGQADDEVLRSNARRLKLAFERFDGIDQVNSFGLHDPELWVEFDPAALAERGLTAIDITQPLITGFKDTAAGKVEVGDSAWLVRIDEASDSPEALAELNLDVPGLNGGAVRLGDVAVVRRARKEPAQLVHFEGRPAVSLAINKAPNTNTIDLIERIAAFVESSDALLASSGLDIVLADDQTVQTRSALGVMETNSFFGLLLVMLVCWAFLGFGVAAMVTLGIVFSVTGTFWLLNITGNTLNVSVLLGIVIVLGMLVDDAVVVVESIYYRLQRGAEPLTAAVDAIGEVGAPVTAAVLTTVSAFLPLMLLPGILGDFMFVIPFVVTIGLLVSLIEAFWILPAHVISIGSHIKIDPQTMKHDRRANLTRIVRLKYGRALAYVIRRPKRFLAAAIAVVALGFAMISSGVIRNEFFTFDPARLFYINITMPADTRLEGSLATGERIEAIINDVLLDGEKRAITVMAGISFTELEVRMGEQNAQLQVSLNPQEKGHRGVAEILQIIRERVAQMPTSAEITYLQIASGPPRLPPINIKVRGDDFEQIDAAVKRLRTIVEGIPQTTDISDNAVEGRREMVLDLQERTIIGLGLKPADVARLMRIHSDGEIVAFIRSQGEKVELRVLAQQGTYESIDLILDQAVALPGGGQTTFRTLVTPSYERGAGKIQHYNFRRTTQVSAELLPDTIDAVTANNMIRKEWDKIAIEFPTIDLDYSGALDDIQESLDALPILGLFGIGLMYLILATQFRSYFQPFLILLTVPLSLTGVVFGLAMTGNPLSLYTMYGAVALTGIAVNSAIVLIDAANSRIAAGMRPLHATMYAARRRVIPILMTTFTTIAGLFSLAVGLGGKSLLWGPVATSIVSGLLVATVLTLFVVPVLYRLFMRGKSVPTGEH